MTTLLTIFHVFVCLILVGVVLLQSGKGASLGASFGGGSSQTLFGSRGAGNLLSKITTAAAIIFMLTSITLAYISNKKSSSMVLEDRTPKAEQPVEQAPPAKGPVQTPAEIPAKQ